MKTLLTTLLFIMFFAFNLIAQDKSADDLIVEGIYQEEVLGNLDKAAELFNQVLKEFSTDRKECAQATYHLGLIAEKGENGKKAKGYYNRILEEYREVGVYADLARNRLEKINNQNTFVDPRDGHKYNWVKIGDQIWMAENLAFMPWVNPPKKQEYGIWVYDYNGDDLAEAKATENYQKYGCLYDWPTAMALDPKYLEEEWDGDPENHQGLCPPGWRMPSDRDWMELESSLGMPDSVLEKNWDRSGESYGLPPIGRSLRSTHSWNSGRNGTNISGFDIMAAGSLVSGYQNDFNGLGYETYIWATNIGGQSAFFSSRKPSAWYRSLRPYPTNQYGDQDEIDRDVSARNIGMSVRCLKVRVNPSEQRASELFVEKVTQNLPKKIQIEWVDLSEANLTQLWFTKIDQCDRVLPNHTDEQFLVSSRDSLMFGIDIRNGKVKWTTNLHGINTIETIIADNHLIGTKLKGIGIRGGGARELFAIDLNNGQLVWTADVGFSPENIQSKNNHLYLAGGTLVCLNLETQDELWRYKIDPPANSDIRTRRQTSIREFTFYQNSVILGLNGFVPDRSKPADPQPLLTSINDQTREILWTFEAPGYAKATHVFYNDMILLGVGRYGYYYSVNPADGILNWKTYVGEDFAYKNFFDDEIGIIRTDNHGLQGLELNSGRIVWEIANINENKRLLGVGDETIYLSYDDIQQRLFVINKTTGDPLMQIKIDYTPFTITRYNNKLFITEKEGVHCYQWPIRLSK